MLGKIISIGKVKRREVMVDASSYNFDKRFDEAMSWVDEDIEVLSVSLVERKELSGYSDRIMEKYIVIYRELEREDIEES